MKAWQYTNASAGLERSLHLNEAAATPPTQLLPKDQVMVEVVSMSVNPVDYKVAELGFLSKVIISTPASPGLDYCGRVAAIGDAVDSYRVGELVFGRLAKPTQHGTLGQYITASHDGCVALPKGVDVDQAVAIGTAGLTAYQCIVPNAKNGDKIFINGGSGGTGTFGIQIGKAIGCHVTTSCSTPNVPLCKQLGADEVIDYRTTNVTEALKAKGQVFDLVVDNVGTPAELYKESTHFLRPSGKFVQVGAAPSLTEAGNIASKLMLPSFLGGGKRSYQFLNLKNSHEDLAQIGRWMQEGRVSAVIDEVFEYEDAPKAYEKLKAGHAQGKIVVHVTDQPRRVAEGKSAR